MPESVIINVLREGDRSKRDPYTIVIVANPVVEQGEYSGRFKSDPIIKKQSKFDDAADYVNGCLFGELEPQGEKFLFMFHL